jgi:Tol biopolymer transport system component
MRAFLALLLSVNVTPMAPTTISIPVDGYASRPAASAGGRFVTYDTSSGVFLYDRQTAKTELIAGGGSFGTAGASADGRYVVFTSSAASLVPGDTNGVTDVFVRDRVSKTIRRVSVASNGMQGNGFSQLPRISRTGRYVVFSSSATNLASGDSNQLRDVFVHDLSTRKTRRITSDAAGDHDPGGISGDGRFVGYVTTVNDIGTAYRKDTKNSSVQLVGTDATEMTLSDNGCVAAFDSASGQIYARDLVTGTLSLVTANFYGQPSSGSASHGAISPNGRYVGFISNASDLPGGYQFTNGVFVRDLTTATTFKASLTAAGDPFGDWSGVGGIADTGITFINGGQVFLRTF